MSKINRLLIANRGEIACRVMRTAARLGIETVAVYSEADREALHVKTADSAVLIGPAPAAESYLVIDRIIEAAKRSGCDAIHPGYGFLSENAAFSRACTEAGIVFVGPPEQAIEVMGDKARSKRAMLKAGVPCVPGYQGEDQTTGTLIRESSEIGYPLMIKAAAGGGGRGMRLVDSAGQLENAIDAARSEARNAFGSDELIIEKAIVRPRHVEVQVFGDSEGNIVYLGERDCSVQRRHQKVIEEAPCPVMTPSLRREMGEAAVAAAAAVSYVGAGTVEFLLSEDGAFYFLEMNTRLQVEHPVTEEITGLDLVELQLQVASGEPLGFSQEDVMLRGHSIEVRLYAEDPASGFLPSTGHIEYWHPPGGAGVRMDGGIESGGDVSPYYDPMLAKIIATGSDREQARRRLVKALGESMLAGPATNRDFLIDALSRDAFIAGEATTAFIEEQYGSEGFSSSPTGADLMIAAVLQNRLRQQQSLDRSTGVSPELLNWSSNVRLQSVCVYSNGGQEQLLKVTPTGGDTYVVSLEGMDDTLVIVHELRDNRMIYSSGNERSAVTFHDHGDDQTLSIATPAIHYTVTDIAAGAALTEAGGDGIITSPMHGQLLDLLVSEGETVTGGQRIAVMEAMKMQHEILADIDGIVAAIHVEVATQVAQDQVLLEITPK